MTIVRNHAPYPQADESTATLSAGGTVTVSNTSSQWPFDNGGKMLLMTSSGASAAMTLYWQRGAGADRFPVQPGQTVGFRAWFATDSNMQVRLGVQFFDSAGASVGSAALSPYATGRFYGGAELTVSGEVPAGATTARVYAYCTMTAGGTVTAGLRMWADRLGVYIDTAENVAAALALGYRDGSYVGWAWEGAPFASTSVGILEPYMPEGRLLVRGVDGLEPLGYLDQLASFELTAEGRSVVHRSATPAAAFPVSVTHRPATSDTGTMVARFTTETGEGLPGVRARRLYDELKRGASYALSLDVVMSGWAVVEFAQVGGITLRREPGMSDRWELEFGIDTTAVGDYL